MRSPRRTAETPFAAGPADKDAKKESSEEYLKRLAKRAAEYDEWNSFEIGKVSRQKETGAQWMVVYFKADVEGEQVHATCDVYGTVEARGKKHVLKIISTSAIVLSDGRATPAGRFDGQELELQ